MSRAPNRIVLLGLLPILGATLVFACSEEGDTPPVEGTNDGGTDGTGPAAPEASVGPTDAANDAPLEEDGGVDAGEDGAADAGEDGGAITCVFVSTSGADTNDGSTDAPFRTISHALAVVGATVDAGADGPRCVKVSPGTYDAAGGETFPLIVPDGTSLLGDEPAKGDGATPTLITGELDIDLLPYPALVIPRRARRWQGSGCR